MPDHGTKHIIMLSIIIIQLLYKSYICSVPSSTLPKLGTKNLYMPRDFRKLENGTKIILNAYFIPYVNICLHQTADATSATPRQNKNANPLHIVVPPSPIPFSFIRFRSVPVRLVSFDRLGTRPSAPSHGASFACYTADN